MPFDFRRKPLQRQSAIRYSFGIDLDAHSASLVSSAVCRTAFNGPGMNSVDDNQKVIQSTRMGLFFIPIALSSVVGCVDGPLYELKKLNPVIQSQWKKDRERGPVFSQRVDEMRLVGRQFPSMPPEEQAKWVNTISSVVQTETSPEIRREAVLALSKVMQQPAATEAVLKLSQDKNDKVRLAVSQSLSKQVTPETTQTLLAMATSDKSESVRLAAMESLGPHKTDDVKQFLMKQLSDRSPAVQYHASLALREFTGKDFKGDVSMWKRYLNGENVEPKAPTFYEAVQPYLPFTR